MSTTTACSISSSPTVTSIPTSRGPARARTVSATRCCETSVAAVPSDHDEVGGPLLLEKSSRGAAFGDIDNDGDIDMLVSAIDDRPMLLRNDTTGGHWITLRLEGCEAIGRRSGRRSRSRPADAGRSRKSEAAAATCRTTTCARTSALARRRRWIGSRSGGQTATVETADSLSADRFYVAREGGVRPARPIRPIHRPARPVWSSRWF